MIESVIRRAALPCLLALLPSNRLAAMDAPVFERDIRPIFREHCYDCHGAVPELKGNFDLRLARLIIKGGDSGPAIVAGKPEASYLLARLRKGEMPPGPNHMPEAQIAVIERWIAAGAPTVRPEPELIPVGLGITAEERAYWSFEPIVSPLIPEARTPARVRTAIDALVLHKMPAGLGFSLDAERSVLVRRAFLDLLGLPPTPREMARWQTDSRMDWYDRLLDELLDSPYYGERWGRHWLDVVGYADSEGSTISDPVRAWAWKYRDWVVTAFNQDKPFDEFIIEQLAGDELAGPKNGDWTARQISLLTATGYLRMAADGTGSGQDNPTGRNQVISDTLKIVATSLLGLSVQCAQCHDHRYDPIPQTDYYALRAVFEPALDWQNWRTPSQRSVSLYTQADRTKASEVEVEAQKLVQERQTKQQKVMSEELEKQLKRVEDESLREPLRAAYRAADDKRTEEQKKLLAAYPFVRQLSNGSLYLYNSDAAGDLKKMDQKISSVRSRKPVEEFLRPLVEPADHTPITRLFVRGDYQQPNQEIKPASLSIAAPPGERPEFSENSAALPTTGRRLALARWLTGGKHPLFARVIVNRVWMHHFGRGLVSTPSDFGKLGSRPTHPALLDWLASEFAAQGWSMKHLHRLIMTSTVWRQSSKAATDLVQPNPDSIDPANQYYWRKPVVRLEAETIRDRMLAASGQLQRTLYGRPIAIKEDDAGQVVVDGFQKRRSLYIQARRSRPVGMLKAFDAPVMDTNCERRSTSTSAMQSLMLMNGVFVLQQSSLLAKESLEEVRKLSTVELDRYPSITPSSVATWQFGYGAVDPQSERTTSFARMPHWTGSSWQGGPKLPDPKLGWAILNATGGHPAGAHAVIRRWTAPADGTVDITGLIGHPSENGDGVHGRIVSNRSGMAGEWIAQTKGIETNVSSLVVAAGDTLDFVTDCRENEASDSFSWEVTITLTSASKEFSPFASSAGLKGPREHDSLVTAAALRAWSRALCRSPSGDELELTVDFLQQHMDLLESDPTKVDNKMSVQEQVLTNLCQALLSSNEFLYSD